MAIGKHSKTWWRQQNCSRPNRRTPAPTGTRPQRQGLKSQQVTTPPTDITNWACPPEAFFFGKPSADGGCSEAAEIRELKAARTVQRSWIQKSFPKLPGFELSGFYRSAGYLSGDLCEVLQTEDGVALLAIADVMGKGAAAALVAASLRMLLRTLSKSISHPVDLLRELNVSLWEDLSAAEMFITLQLVRVDTKRATLTFANAGHCPALLAHNSEPCRASSDSPVAQLSSIAPDGLPLGVVPSPGFAAAVFPLHPSTCLLLYTDGLSETTGIDGTLFGQTKLANGFKRNLGAEASQVVSGILTELKEFESAAQPKDDLTLLVLAGGKTERYPREFRPSDLAALVLRA